MEAETLESARFKYKRMYSITRSLEKVIRALDRLKMKREEAVNIMSASRSALESLGYQWRDEITNSICIREAIMKHDVYEYDMTVKFLEDLKNELVAEKKRADEACINYTTQLGDRDFPAGFFDGIWNLEY